MNTSKKNEVSNQVNQICETFDLLDGNIEKINKKINDITKIYYKLSDNSSLETGDTNSYLKFQIELLTNEKNYYTSVKKSVKDKFVSDMYTISESILMLLGSIETIKIDNIDEKKNILKRVNSLKRYKKKLETPAVLELVNSTLYNLELINEFVSIFDKFIKETIEKNKRENLHCNNFKVNLENKKEQILLEYKKFTNKTEELVEYFLECSKEISEQLKHQKLLDFLIVKKE